MKRIILLSGLLVALVASALAFHVRLDARTASSRLNETLATTGLSATIGAAGLRLLPVPHIAMKAVSVTAADGRMAMQAPAARASIEWLPLLAGRVAYNDLRIDGATVSVEAVPSANAGIESIAAIVTALADLPARLSVNDTTLSVVRQGVTLHTLNELTATARRRDGQGRTPVLAKFRYGSRDVTLEALAPGSASTGRSQMSGLRIDARSTGFMLKATLPSQSQPAGDIALSVTQAAQTLGWLGLSSPLANVFERVNLQGRLSQQATSWDVDNAKLSVDGQDLEGALSWNTARDRPVFSGTLAGSTLNLGQLITRLAGARLNQPDMAEWGFDPSETSGALLGSTGRTHDLDLRLSLEKASIGAINLEEAAAQILFSPARIDLNLVQARLNKGTVKARYTVTRATFGGEQRVQVGFDKLDLASISQAVFASRRLSGLGTGQLILEGGGTNLKGLVRSAHGRASLSIRQGEVEGFALADTLRRLERQPLIALRDWRTGRSAFDHAQFSGIITQGVLDLTEGAVTAPGFVLSLGGQVSLADQTLALKGLLAHPTGRNLQVPFEIAGPWEQPAIKPRLDPAVFQRTGTSVPARP